MICVLNQYVPRRWAVLLVGESLLFLAALSVAVAVDTRGWPDRAAALSLGLRAVLITVVCQICLHYRDLYAPLRHNTAGEILLRLLQALGIASLVLALVYWMLPDARLGTAQVAGSVAAMLLVLLAWRRAMDWGMKYAHHAHPAGERLLVMGSEERAQQLVRELERRPQLGLMVVGVVGAGASGEGTRDTRQEAVAACIARYRPDRIVLALGQHLKLPVRQLLAARTAGIRIEEAPTLLERLTGRVALDSIRPRWLLLTDGFRVSLGYRVFQRVVDLGGAAAGLLLAAPLLLLVTVAIRLDSPGAILYRQERVGRNGRRFNILKFRSMRADAESASGPMWAQTHDARVTRLGYWLRRLRLDEIPQLFNVLRGDMSIVGPRPERPVFVEEFRRTIPYYDLRHSVRPGITGWAQVSRDYGASLEDAREKLEYELFYIKNVSIWLDLFILFQTTKIIALGRGAR